MRDADFPSFKRIPRLHRRIVVTEKLDGTNGLVSIAEDGTIRAGTRNRWIVPGDDNYGFAAWVAANQAELAKLGPGNHYGEWYGVGIARGYGLFERRFALFNAGKWNAENKPTCCEVVTVLGESDRFNPGIIIDAEKRLWNEGSIHVRGFKHPEGICIFHEAAQQYFKFTLDGDGHKGAR